MGKAGGIRRCGPRMVAVSAEVDHEIMRGNLQFSGNVRNCTNSSVVTKAIVEI